MQYNNKTFDGWGREFQNRLLNDFRSRSGRKLFFFLEEESLSAGPVLSSLLKDGWGDDPPKGKQGGDLEGGWLEDMPSPKLCRITHL